MTRKKITKQYRDTMQLYRDIALKLEDIARIIEPMVDSNTFEDIMCELSEQSFDITYLKSKLENVF